MRANVYSIIYLYDGDYASVKDKSITFETFIDIDSTFTNA